MTAPSWKRINSAHYRALRAIYGDYRSKMKRVEFDKLSKSATPVEWAHYAIASATIKLFNTLDTNIARALRDSIHVNDRLPGRGKFIDKSRQKIGRQSLPYIIGPIFGNMSVDWIQTNLSDDTLRRKLKSKFFRYFDDNPC